MILDDNPVNINDENIEDKDKCRICGKKINLTKEHIPPRCTGNNSDFDVFIPENKERKLTYKRVRFNEGFFLRTLCENCNNRTGLKYVIAYNDFISQIKEQRKLYDNKNNLIVRLKNIYPLRIIKQLYVMHLAIQDEYYSAYSNIQNYVKNIKSRICDNHFNVFMYYNLSFTGRLVPFVTRSCLLDHSMIMISEISFPPIGFVLAKGDLKCMSKFSEITDFMYNDYDKKIDVKLFVPELKVETGMPLGFGSAQKVDYEMNKFGYLYFLRGNLSYIIETGGGLSPL